MAPWMNAEPNVRNDTMFAVYPGYHLHLHPTYLTQTRDFSLLLNRPSTK